MKTLMGHLKVQLILSTHFLKFKFATAVFKALAQSKFPHIYPDPESRRLREQLVCSCKGLPFLFLTTVVTGLRYTC